MRAKVRSSAAYVLCGVISLLLLSGGKGCPLTVDTGSSAPTSLNAEGTTPGIMGTGADLNLGGLSGAYWDIAYGEQIDVAFQVKVKPEWLPYIFDLASFCYRSDVVCPHQLFGQQTRIFQSTDYPGEFFVEFQHKGPLALNKDQVLRGALKGKELMIPLGKKKDSKTKNAEKAEVEKSELEKLERLEKLEKLDPQKAAAERNAAERAAAEEKKGTVACALTSTSVAVARAFNSWGAQEISMTASGGGGQGTPLALADTIIGRITMGFSGGCFTYGGKSGSLPPDSVVMLSQLFKAKRQSY
jgi:hypothetical protein